MSEADKLFAELYALISSAEPDWFTEEELAIYLRLVGKDGRNCFVRATGQLRLAI